MPIIYTLCLFGLFLFSIAWFSACEVDPFDPRGYRCEADINCLPDYYCNKNTKICVPIPQDEPAAPDASEPTSEAAAESATPDTPIAEASPEPAPREAPTETSTTPESSTETNTPDAKATEL